MSEVQEVQTLVTICTSLSTADCAPHAAQGWCGGGAGGEGKEPYGVDVNDPAAVGQRLCGAHHANAVTTRFIGKFRPSPDMMARQIGTNAT